MDNYLVLLIVIIAGFGLYYYFETITKKIECATKKVGKRKKVVPIVTQESDETTIASQVSDMSSQASDMSSQASDMVSQASNISLNSGMSVDDASIESIIR